MKIKKFLSCMAITALAVIAPLAGCTSAPLEKTGENVMNAIEGVAKTEYVFCVSKNSPKANEYLTALNAVIDSIDYNELTLRYLDRDNRARKDFFGEFSLEDCSGDPVKIYTSVMSPYQFSGAYGNGVDGIDMYSVVKMALNIHQKPVIQDVVYNAAYEFVKSGKGDILATGVAKTAQVEAEFLTTKVYSSGYQQIVCDKAYSYTKLSQLKDLKIGVLTGRTGYTLVKDAIDKGQLGAAEMVVYETDAEAYADYLAEMCDVLVVDEYSAKVMLKLKS